MTRSPSPLWIFAYGSLIWSPDFSPAEARRARLPGYARRFCLRSTEYRGTPEAPGLVLGLVPDDGACEGVALRVPDEARRSVLRAVRRREMSSGVYEEIRPLVHLDDGRSVSAVAFAARPQHRDFVSLPIQEKAGIIRRAAGNRGPNLDYLLLTERRLSEMGVEDAYLRDVVRTVSSFDATVKDNVAEHHY